ncbi:hypothetical protein VOLCADRAFT_90160 [Volvox carteri f. nagariensis]|uniref:Ubiquitin-like domain-containing protein n=1 Tax=Volvox carteri f. nagariensis TaxID=3068 RepID=D8TTM5_VOLCA|nr:uncharacterized protein VOLCADRAFT_90160 [Volvox carteri f. nagariensis]EFJ49334.1 hypothetical protein VOLCADRAFT_90160 [Volvox carteri f. nagariensis]|eukprot:XP_002949782.1 hypothetical protein VOLCADRAFT_90160 [Volvox carteri f. nagariensis]
MAAYGEDLGNQIFVTLRRGDEWPPRTVDVRVRYEQTIGDLKAAAAKALQVPVDKQQLFWHGKELTSAYDSRTLLDMDMHTGFALQGYDLTVPPKFWPPVKETPEGLVVLA